MFPDLGKILFMAEELIKELKVLNGHLFDIKKIAAYHLRWRIIEEKKEKDD